MQNRPIFAGQQPPKITVIYDGECPVCLKGKSQLEKMDRTHRLEYVPLQDTALLNTHPELDPAELRKSMHVILPGGEVYKGAQAFRELGKVVSFRSIRGLGLHVYADLCKIPGVLPLAETVYAQIAKRRYKLFPALAGSCTPESCTLPPPGSRTP